MMRTREIADTGVMLTELGFGAASIGNLYRETTEEEAAGAVAAAWQSGIRYFDTAPHYGLGLSERRLGQALKELPRESLVVSTKVGRLLEPHHAPTESDGMFKVRGDLKRVWDFSRDGILRSLEASLLRLGLDYVDVLLLHDPDQSGIAGAAETGAETLLELRDEGVVRAVGIGSNSADAVADAFRRTDIDVAMLAGRYTLLEQQGADAVFEAAARRSIISVGVFNSGLLSKPRPELGAMYNYEPAGAEQLDAAIRLATIAEVHGATLPQAAVAFPLLRPEVAGIAIGMRTAEQVRANVELYENGPHPSFWEEVLV
ncbi:aldo/keto reductase [Microbacterium sp.]|uniref:aldo/keto reductase n=1 Tax=Microbacterium sp. TaxID=51671 RepID=UPI003F6F06B0